MQTKATLPICVDNSVNLLSVYVGSTAPDLVILVMQLCVIRAVTYFIKMCLPCMQFLSFRCRSVL